jgi:hypothetical protein
MCYETKREERKIIDSLHIVQENKKDTYKDMKQKIISYAKRIDDNIHKNEPLNFNNNYSNRIIILYLQRLEELDIYLYVLYFNNIRFIVSLKI